MKLQMDKENFMVVSTNYISGYRIKDIPGFTYGLVVRSRGLGGNIVASLRTIFGGEIKEYTELLNEARQNALDRLIEHAKSMGANAVINVRFDSSEIGANMSEIIAYGTAVVIEKDDGEAQAVRLM